MPPSVTINAPWSTLSKRSQKPAAQASLQQREDGHMQGAFAKNTQRPKTMTTIKKKKREHSQQ